jgi:putative transposase
MTFNSHPDPFHLYFITASLCKWEKLFFQPKYSDIVLNSLRWLREQKLIKLYAFVIMPDHIHAILKPIDKTIGETLQQFGSFTAHAILKQLKVESRTDILTIFSGNRRDSSRNYSVWQDIQAKDIYSVDFLRQKLEYIHNNPASRTWHLVEDRSGYHLSSASYYDLGLAPVIEIDDAGEWLI